MSNGIRFLKLCMEIIFHITACWAILYAWIDIRKKDRSTKLN